MSFFYPNPIPSPTGRGRAQALRVGEGVTKANSIYMITKFS